MRESHAPRATPDAVEHAIQLLGRKLRMALAIMPQLHESNDLVVAMTNRDRSQLGLARKFRLLNFLIVHDFSEKLSEGPPYPLIHANADEHGSATSAYLLRLPPASGVYPRKPFPTTLVYDRMSLPSTPVTPS